MIFLSVVFLREKTSVGRNKQEEAAYFLQDSRNKQEHAADLQGVSWNRPTLETQAFSKKQNLIKKKLGSFSLGTPP